MTVLSEVLAALAGASIPCALIGAGAMAAHGVSRSTMDADLLIVDASALALPAWRDLARSGAKVDIRRGDADDPLAGVVRISREGQFPVDVVVGRSSWQKRAIQRARTIDLDGDPVAVVAPVDLVLLKLFAGSPRDLHDVGRLLVASSDSNLRAKVEEALADLPPECREAWRAVPTTWR